MHNAASAPNFVVRRILRYSAIQLFIVADDVMMMSYS